MEKLQKRHGWLRCGACIRTTSAIFPPGNYADSQFCFELKNYGNGWLRCIPKFKSRFDLNQSGILYENMITNQMIFWKRSGMRTTMSRLNIAGLFHAYGGRTMV